METLREFILDEMHKRRMSGREFADFVGVANSTIVRATDYQRTPPVPTLEFLGKLARATKVDICTLVAFIYPDLTNTQAQASIIGILASHLPAERQDAILAMLRGWGVEIAKNEAQ